MEPDEELVQLKTLVSQLKDLIRSKDDEVQEKSNALKESESKLSKSKLQLKAKDAKISSLSKQLSARPKKSEDASQKHDWNTDLKKSLHEKESTIKQQLKIIREQDQKIADLQKDANGNGKQTEQAASTNSQDARKIEELTQSISNKDVLIGTISTRVQELQNAIHIKNKEMQVMQGKLIETQTLSDQQKLLLDKLTTTVAQQEEKVAMVSEERSTGLSHLQDNVAELAEEVVSLQSRLQDKEGTVSILEAHILQLKREHKTQMDDIMSGNEEQDELLRTLKRRMHEQDEVMSGKEKVLQLLQDEAADKVQEHEELRRTISILQQTLRETVESKELLQEALKSQERSGSPSQAGLIPSSLLEEKDKLIAEKDNIIRDLSASLQQQESIEHTDALQEECLTLKEKVRSLQESVEKWQALARDSSEALELKEEEFKLTVNNFEETVKSVTDELAQTKKLYDELVLDSEKRMKTVLMELDSQTKVLEKQTKEMNSLLQEKELLENQSTGAASELSSFNSDSTKKEYNDLKDEHSQAISDIENLRKQNESLILDMKTHEEKLQSSRAENASLKERVRDLEEKENKLNARLRDLDDDYAQLIEEFASKEDILTATWNQQRNDLLKELQQVEERCRQESNAEIASLQNQASDLSLKLDDSIKRERESSDKLKSADKTLEEFEMAKQSIIKEYEEKCADLSERNSNLETDIKRHVSACQNLSEELDNSRRENLSSKEELHALKSLYDSSNHELESVQNKLETLQGSSTVVSQELNATLKNLENEKDNLVTALESLERDKNMSEEKLNERILVLTGDLNNNSERIRTLSAELDALAIELKAATDEKETTLEMINENENLVRDLEERLTSANKEKSDLESRLREFDGVDDVRSANKTLMSDNKSLEEGLQKAKNEIEGLTSAQEERERQLSINSQELQRAASENGALLDQVGVLEKRLEEKSRFCEDLEKSASELKTLCRESAGKLEELQSSTAEQLSSRKVEIDNLNALNLQITIEKDYMSVNYDDLNTLFCKLQDDFSAVSSSNDRFVEENKELSTQCQDLAQKATDFETRMRVLVEEYDGKVSSLQSSLSAIEQERESLLEENQGLISHVNEVSANSSSLEERIQQDHTASEEKVASLQSLILSKDEGLASVWTQNSQLSAKVQELSEGNLSLRSEIEELRKYQKDSSDLMATFETLRETHASLEVHKNTLSAQLESTMEEVNLLKSERDKGKEIFQKVIKDLQTALDSVAKEKQSSDQECAAKSNENVALNAELKKLSVSCEEQNSKLLNLRQENEVLENKVKDLHSENAGLDEKLRESAGKYENQISELEAAVSRDVEEKEMLQKSLDDVTVKFEKVKSSLQAKELDVMKKVQLLEQMSTQYASLRSELQASHRLVTEMGIPALSEEVVDTEVRHDQRQASVESELEEAKKKLDNVQHERDNAQHEAALLRRISRDNSHDFQEGPDSQLVSSLSGSTHKGGLEYLQSQLAELANEQEQQALEHQRVATALSEKVERLTAEKDRLVESLNKQTSEFEEVLKSLQEKETECQQLDSVISEQRRDLSLVNEQLNKVSKSSDLQQRSLANLDEKCVQLQDKNKSLNDTLESQETSRHELEVELREVKSLSKKTHDRNLILDEQNEKLAHAASMLQQDLDQAMEQIEVLNHQYTDDTGKLKSLLRERDEEISLLKDDAESKRQEIESLLQTVEERNSVCSDLEERLNAQSEKVGKLQTLIRQHEAELALISELEGEKEKAAAKAKELSDYISQLENGNSTKESTIQELMSKVDSLQSDVLDKNAELDRISRENSKVQESHQRKALENESRLTGTENELLSLREQLERSAQAISSLSKTIEAKDDELTNLKELCEQRENQQFNVQEELASMQQLVQVKEESFREQLLIENEKFEKAKKSEIEALTSRLERQFEEANSHHQSKIDSLQADIAKLRDAAALLGIEKETAQNELFDEKEKAIELQETGEKWEKEAQQKSRLCDDLQSTVNLLNERTEQASAKLREFEQENSTLRRSLSEASEKASEKENLVMKLDEALTMSNSEVRKLRDQLSEESQRQVKEMDSMLNSSVEERDEHIKNLETEKSALEKNLSEAIKEQNALKETCSELEIEFESVRKEHELKLEELTRKHAEDLGALNSLVEENRVTMEQITNKRKMDEAKEEAWMKTCSDLEFQLNNARADLESTLLNLSTSNEKENELSLEVAKLNDMLNESQDATSKHQAQMEKAKKIVHGLRVQLKQSKEKSAKLEKELEKGSGEKIGRESDRKISEQNLSAAESEATEVEILSSSANQDNHNQNEVSYRETIDDLSSKLAAEQLRSLELSEKMIENKDVIDRLENEKEQMTKTMREIELELKNQQDNVTSMQASLVSEKEKYEGLFSSMSQKDGEFNALREQLSDLEESIIVLQKEKTSFEEALNRSSEELRIASALNAESEEKVQSLRSGLSSKDSELSETANKLGIYQQMYEESEMLQSSLKSNVESVSGLLATKDEECRQLTIENNALKASVDEISRDKSALDHEFQVYRDMQGSEMSAKIEELQSRFENDAKILKEFKSKCLDFESVISKKDEAIRSLELETENLKESVSNRSEELNKSVVECESLKKELKIAEDSIRESYLKLQAVIEEHQDSKVGDEEISQKFESQIRQLSTELQSLQSVNDTLKKNLQNSENEIGGYKQVVEDLKSKLAVAEERSGATESRYLSILGEKDAELKQIRDAYEQSNVGMVNLKEELSSVRQMHNETVAEMSEKLARLEEEKADFSADDDSRRAHNTLQQADNSQNTSCDDSKDKIPELEKELQEKSKSLAEAQRKLKASLVSRKSVMEKLKAAEKKLKGFESGVEVPADDQNVSLNQSFDSTASNDSKILTEINEENATLKREMADATDRIVKLESELGKEKERSSNIDIEVSELRERCEHLSSQIENKNSEYDILQNHVEENKSQLVDMEALYNEKETAFKNEIKEISGCFESKQAECASLQDDLSAILDEKENLASKVDALTADLRRKESEWDELRTADSESELLQSRLNEQEERNSEMNIVISDLEHDLEKARSSRKEMEIRIESLEWKLVEFDRVSKECDNERQNAEAARQELEEERATCQESQLRYGDEIAALKTDLASMKEEKDRFEIECLTLKKEKGRASAAAETEQVRLLQKSSDNAVKERELLQRKLKAALVSRKELIVQEKEMKEELAELRGYRDKYHESDGALRDLSEREKAKDEELAEMKGRREKDVRILKESRKKLANLEKEISEKERAVQEEIHKREEMERTLADSSERLKNKEGEIATLESCNEDLNEIVTALESKNKGLQKKLEEDIETIRGLRKEIKTISEGDDSASKADLTELTEKLEAAEWDRDSLQETVSRLEAEKREKASMLDKVLEDFEKESMAKQETAGRCSELEAELNGLKLEMNELRECMAREKGIEQQETLRQTVRDLNDALGSAEREHATVAEQKQILESRIKEMEESQEDKITLDTLVQENTDLRESVASLRETISALEDEKEALKNDKSQVSNDEENKIRLDTLAQENKDLRELVASLRDTISTLEDDKDILQAGQSQISNDKENKIRLATLVQQNNDLKESVASLRETISALEDEKESLINDRSQPASPFRASSISTEIPDDPLVLDQDVLLAKRTILEETLGQLRVTQPDNWEQQPGIKKLIDKLEYLAEKAASTKKEEARQREACVNALAHAKKMELQLSSARETVDMNERTIEQLTHEVSGLRGRVMELEIDNDDSSALHELAQLEDKYKRVLSESRLQTVSFGEIEKKRKEEKAALEERIEGLENERDALIRDLDLKSGEMEDLKESVPKLVPPKNRTYSESSREEMGSKTNEPGADKTSASPLVTEVEIDKTQAADDTTSTVETENLSRSSAEASRELENREELIAELLSDCKRLKTEVIAKSDIATSLETEASALRSELKSLACLKTQYESNENHLKSELAEKDRVLQRLKSELAYSRIEQERLHNEFGAGTPQEVQTILNAYLGDINNLKSTLFATSNALDAKERDITNLNGEVRRKQDEIESLTLEMEALTEKHENNQVLVQDMQQQVESLSQENVSYRSQLDEFGDISKTLDDKETTINTLTSDKDALNTSLIDSKSLLSELQGECSQLRADLESSSLLLEERQNLIATLAEERDKNSAAETENTTFRERIDDLAAELEAKNSALKAIFEQKESLSVDLKERDARVESLENENVQLRATAESADAKLSEVEREYVAYVKSSKDQRHRVSVAESSLSSLTGQLAALHDRYSVASRVLDQVAVTMPAPKVTEEILVKSADRVDSDVRLLSAESLKEKNPLVRLERKLESYEKALVWVDGEKARVEIENAQKRDELESLRVSYEENALELERVQAEFMEATAALRDLECQIDERKGINRQLESQLEGVNIELQEASAKIQRGEIAERDVQTQRQQIEQLLSERQQLANQLHTTHSSLQEYQSSYTDLLSEYKRLTAQLNEGSTMSTPEKHNGTLDQGAPVGPPVRALSGSPEHDSLHQSLDTVRAEKSQLAIKLAQVQSQLSDEIHHRTEVEDLLQNLRQNQSSLESVRVVSDEDEPILMKPSSIVRKVRSSTSTSCSRWLRGRSLRWANSTSARPCRHFRPLSIQTLIILYFIGLHILIIKCFLL